MKTSSSKLAAIRKWQAANQHAVKMAHNRYEQKNRAKRNAQRAAYARRKAMPGGKARQLEGLRKIRRLSNGISGGRLE